MNKKGITSINEIWDEVFGPIGSDERNKAEAEAESFCHAERLNEESDNTFNALKTNYHRHN